MTIDEIFAALPEEVAQDVHEYLVIDPVTRTIQVPQAESIFGVEIDSDSERKYFICPRYVGDKLDLAACFLSIKYRNANGEKDEYLVEDTAVNGEYVTFSWLISEKVVKYKGVVQFRFYADPSTGKAWGTTLAQGESLEGLEPDTDTVEEETSDVVTQLRAMVTQQTGNVEAVGAAQVAAVKAQGANTTQEAVEAIQAQGAATLATIPADYATLAGKANEQANAIKGHLAGEIVQAADVSPVEHYLGVKVHGKNLWNMAVITSAYEEFTNNGDGTITVHGGKYYCRAAQTLAEICPQLRSGDVAKFTISTTGYNAIYLSTAGTLVQDGYVLTITDDMLASYVVLYGILNTDDTFNEPHTISSIQLELGDTATDYTPYIDPTGVTVTRRGKNLLNSEIMKEQATLNGVTITRAGDLLTLNGTLTVDSVLYSTPFLLHGVLGNHYTLSYKYLSGTAEGTASVCVGDCETAGAARQSWANIRMYERDNSFTYQLLKPYIKDLWFYAMAGVTFTNYKIKIQLEAGESATEYETSTNATAMPDESGVVTGLPSLAPTMTLLTDTAGVKIECTYNRDSNAVYAELLAKIAALSGTT